MSNPFEKRKPSKTVFILNFDTFKDERKNLLYDYISFINPDIIYTLEKDTQEIRDNLKDEKINIVYMQTLEQIQNKITSFDKTDITILGLN